MELKLEGCGEVGGRSCFESNTSQWLYCWICFGRSRETFCPWYSSVVVVQDSNSALLKIPKIWSLVMEAECCLQGHPAVFSPWILSRKQKRHIATWTTAIHDQNVKLLNSEFCFFQGCLPFSATKGFFELGSLPFTLTCESYLRCLFFFLMEWVNLI